jgi:hypothetical protein
MAKETGGNELYEADFYAWTQQQAKLLRERRWEDLDIENLVEEVHAVGISERREIKGRLIVLLAHLLKWMYQPGNRSSSWAATIREQRRQLAFLVEDSPSLKGYPAQILPDQYEAARLQASDEAGIALDLFPSTCPFTCDQALDASFLPDEPCETEPIPG